MKANIPIISLCFVLALTVACKGDYSARATSHRSAETPPEAETETPGDTQDPGSQPTGQPSPVAPSNPTGEDQGNATPKILLDGAELTVDVPNWRTIEVSWTPAAAQSFDAGTLVYDLYVKTGAKLTSIAEVKAQATRFAIVTTAPWVAKFAGTEPGQDYWIYLVVSGASGLAALYDPINVTTPALTPFAYGQSSLTSNFQLESGFAAFALGMGHMSGTRFCIVDKMLGRVNLWNNWDGDAPLGAPDVVVGKPTKAIAIIGASIADNANVSRAESCWIEGNKLLVVDSGLNRVLIWNTWPTSDGQAADVVLGQADFASVTANRGGTAAADTLRLPFGIVVVGGKLVVSDRGNNRLLVWDSVPTVNGAAATAVLGQSGFTGATGNQGGRQLNRLSGVAGLATDGTTLWAADVGNRRVLGWVGAASLTTNASATLLIGQSDGTTLQNANTASRFITHGIAASATQVWVFDHQNYRILQFTAPGDATSDPAATVVFGQPDTTTVTATEVSPQTVSRWANVMYGNGKLYVLDESFSRIAAYAAPFTSKDDVPLAVHGQPAASTKYVFGKAPSDGRIARPGGMAIAGSKFFAAGEGCKIYVWDRQPTLPEDKPGKVLGTAAVDDPCPASTSGASDVAYADFQGGMSGDDTTLAVASSSHSRVLIWHGVDQITSNQAANVVIGQSDTMTTTSNSGGRSAATLAGPRGVFVGHGKLIVADTGNHRILIWNSIPTTNGQAADRVLGQATMATGTANLGGLSAKSLNVPTRVFYDGTRLYVSDAGNNRVLIWNSLPASDYSNADVVLGQPDFVSSGSAASPTTTGASLYNPQGIHVRSGKLYVIDMFNYRVLVWNSVPTVSGTSADAVLGQSDLMTRSLSGAADLTMTSVADIAFGDRYLYFSSHLGNRIFAYPLD